MFWRRQYAVLVAYASDKTPKQTLLTKGNGANGGKLTVVHRELKLRLRFRMVQGKITSPCVSKKEVDASASADHLQDTGERTMKSWDSEPSGPIREKIE